MHVVSAQTESPLYRFETAPRNKLGQNPIILQIIAPKRKTACAIIPQREEIYRTHHYGKFQNRRHKNCETALCGILHYDTQSSHYFRWSQLTLNFPNVDITALSNGHISLLLEARLT